MKAPCSLVTALRATPKAKRTRPTVRHTSKPAGSNMVCMAACGGGRAGINDAADARSPLFSRGRPRVHIRGVVLSALPPLESSAAASGRTGRLGAMATQGVCDVDIPLGRGSRRRRGRDVDIPLGRGSRRRRGRDVVVGDRAPGPPGLRESRRARGLRESRRANPRVVATRVGRPGHVARTAACSDAGDSTSALGISGRRCVCVRPRVCVGPHTTSRSVARQPCRVERFLSLAPKNKP